MAKRALQLSPETFQPSKDALEQAEIEYQWIVEHLAERGMSDAIKFVTQPQDPGSWQTAIEALEFAVDNLDPDDLPELHGKLERLKTLTLLNARTQEPELFDAQQLATRWGVPDSWVYRQAREGKLEKTKRGKYVRFTKQAVETFEDKYGSKPKVL